MLQTLKIKGEEKNIFFVSDLHWGHKCVGWDTPLFKRRNYDTLEAHDEGVIQIWNQYCDENSVVFHTGDLILNAEGPSQFMSLVPRLKFKQLWLLWGNHNASQSSVYKSEIKRLYPSLAEDVEIYPLKSDLVGREVIFLPTYAEVQINKDLYILCHYPIYSYNQMNRKGKESTMICGHSHNSCLLTSIEGGDSRRIDVGWCGWKKPVSISELKTLLKNRKISSPDHH